MKYLIINTVAGYTSTGRITAELCRKLIQAGNESILAYGRTKANCDDIPTHRIGTDFDYILHGVATRLFDKHGFGSKHATKKFVQWIKAYDPDIIWMHNIHGYYLNIEIMFDYLRQCGKEIRWTLHDCWSFTGHCPYFSIADCYQWKDVCTQCRQKKRYPSCKGISNVRKNFLRKKKAFSNIDNLTIITPSEWLKNLVKQSFLKEYPVQVIENKTDPNIFKPTVSDFREQYKIEHKYMILGVANGWGAHKGLEDFYRLYEMLDKEKYAMVIVGLEEKQLQKVPEGIIGLPKTKDATELAKIYTAADVLVSASREETFGMTPEEARACGTPSIVYRNTACEEIARKYGNAVVDQSPEAIYEAITGHRYTGDGLA